MTFDNETLSCLGSIVDPMNGTKNNALQYLEHPNETFGNNVIATMPALVTLPTEIIRKICDQLVPDKIDTHATLPLPDEHQLRQRGLWSLTLVSYRIGGIATEFLYKNMVIQSTKNMVCLFRTIYHKPDLRGHARYLANLVPLMDSRLQEKIEADIQRHFPLLPTSVTNPIRVYPRELYQLDPPELFSCKPLWTHELIRHMRELCHLGVRNDWPPAFNEDTDQAFFTETLGFRLLSGGPRTLRIKLVGDTCRPGEGDLLGPLFQLYFTPYISNGCRVTDLRFLNLVNVTSYKITESSFNDLDAIFGPNHFVRSGRNRGFLSRLARLKALDLGFSTVDPQKVGQLLAACPNLKKLTWTFSPMPPPDYSSHVELALQQTTGHLNILHLSLDTLCGPISLRHFRALKVLLVGIEVLSNHSRRSGRTGDDPAPPSVVETPFVSLLPESLVDLTLMSANFRPRGSGRRRGTQTAAQLDYRDILDGYVAHGRQLFPTSLVDSLEVFSRSCQAMPNFRSFTVIQPFHGILPVDSEWQIEVGDLTAGFGAAGVRFSTIITPSRDYV
ncbi:hypothetical protein F4782DRAFT_550236 [Xylaria castorea]|nr:hypothetical protein F4782DRAFT_550236 [Xylaria castorea]